jgi:NAD(P)-dependent dehydrogenase (short-subunit alcohol dehydrogenase family)
LTRENRPETTSRGFYPVGRAGTPDEVGTVGALLMGPDGAFITGSDFLMDGGVTASNWYGELAPQ